MFAMLKNPDDPMAFFRGQGKQAALYEFGMSKEALPAFLARAGGAIRGLFRRGASKAAPMAGGGAGGGGLLSGKVQPGAIGPRPARDLSGFSNPQQAGAASSREFPQQMLNPEINGALRPDVGGVGGEALRKDMMARSQAAAAEAAKNPEKGLLSSIPWWGKALGAGAVGYGGYRMLKKPDQEPQGIQPYYGPGTPQMPGY
jgi:hypothetical protein